MNNRTTFFVLIFSLVSYFTSNAQVEKVSLGLKFNQQTNLFDCYMKVEKGQALLSRHRIQFNAQISLVVPTNSTVTLAKNYMPLQENHKYTGVDPMRWNITNAVKTPTTLESSDVIGITPSMTPTSFYNDLNEGDEVKLFSVNISPLPKCGEGVRLFNNDSDPNSSSRGMNGGDFRNGFTVGNAEQKYSSNFTNINPLLPNGELAASNDVFVADNFTLNAGSWTNAVSYAWEGPNGYKSNVQNPTISNVTLKNAGKYTLTVSNELGCSVSKTTTLNVSTQEDLAVDVVKENNTESVKGNNAVSVSSKLFPNPASEFINLTIKAPRGAAVNATIFNVDGKVVMLNAINQKMESTQLDKSIPLNLAAGIYTVKVVVNESVTEHKFICVE